MQRVGTSRRRIIFYCVIPVIILLLLIGVDRGTKILFTSINENRDLRYDPIKVVGDFLHFSYTLNSGSAYGFLSGKSWAQTFFKILTSVALVLFFLGFLWSIKKGYKTLLYSFVFIIGGTIGNFIDRVANGKVVDFICIEIAGKDIFGVFNLADVFLTAGVILVLVHFCFFDEGAIFKKRNDERKSDDKISEGELTDTDDKNEK